MLIDRPDRENSLAERSPNELEARSHADIDLGKREDFLFASGRTKRSVEVRKTTDKKDKKKGTKKDDKKKKMKMKPTTAAAAVATEAA